MKRFTYALLLLSFTSVSLAGEFGTIDLKYLNAGPKLGHGGVFNWEIVSGPNGTFPSSWSLGPSLKANGDLISYCIEIGVDQYISGGTYDIRDLDDAPIPGPAAGDPDGNGTMSASQADVVGRMTENYFVAASTGVLNALLGTSLDASQQAGAFQLAIWEVIYGDSNTANGIVSGTGTGFNDDVKSAAQQMIDNPGSDLSKYKAVALTRYVDGTTIAQDQIILVSVPEASSLLAFASVACAIGLVMYRRRK